MNNFLSAFFAPRTAIKYQQIFFGLMLLLGTHTSMASMQLSNVILHFEPGEPARQDVEIANTGDEPLYVDIQPSLVLSPGTQQEDRSVIKNPREAGLLVTPNKLIVPPGATKVVRMVKLAGGPVERVYRIVAKPVASGVEAEQSGLKIMVGYEILAIVYPNNAKPELDVRREGTKLFVKNTGNASRNTKLKFRKPLIK